MKRSIAIADRGTYAEGRLWWPVLLSGAVLVALLWATAASGATAYYSFEGWLGSGVVPTQYFAFAIDRGIARPAPFSLRTWHYGGTPTGQTNAAGDTIPGGSFDPILRLYHLGGSEIVTNDDGPFGLDSLINWSTPGMPELLDDGSYGLDLVPYSGDGPWAVDLEADAGRFTLTNAGGFGSNYTPIYSLKTGSDDPRVPAMFELASSSELEIYHYHDLDGRFVVGQSGGAAAVIKGDLDTGHSVLGWEAGSVGSMILDYGDWEDHHTYDATYVGFYGEGNLEVRDQSDAVFDYNLVLAKHPGSEGSVTVTGPYSYVEVFSNIEIGAGGTGTLRVENQGHLNCYLPGNQDADVVASLPLSTGTVDVDGHESLWETDPLIVGGGGQGIVRVANGGKIDTHGSSYIGKTAGAAASSVTVAGLSPEMTKATWLVGRNLHIAGDESGPSSAAFSKLTISTGGLVDVSGTTTVWESGGNLELLGGEMETGSLIVKPGATFTHTDGTLTVDGGTFDPGVSNYNYTIDGVMATSLPIVRLLGGASTSLSESILVGLNQNGRLEAHDGSDISLAGPYSRLLIGHGPDSHGEVIVSGQGSSLTTTGGFTVGYEGHGVLRVLDGGVVSDTAASSGEMIAGIGGTGLVEVAGTAPDGTPSTYTAHGLFYVGPGGHATLTISNGGRVNALAYAAIVGDYGTSATVSGAGSRWSITDALYVGGNDMMGGGSGRLTIMNGGLVSADRVTIWEPGAVELSGGTVHTGSIALEGTLRGTGNVTGGGQLDNAGLVSPGLLTPGAAAGTIHLAGDYAQLATGAMEMEIGGLAPSQFDRLQVDGAATLGGSLRIDLIDPMGGSNPYQPSAGDSFPLLTAGLLGPPSFSDVILPVLGPDLRMVVIGDLLNSTLLAKIFLSGDYNFDGLVDAADYTVWRDTLGSKVDMRANGDDTGASAGVIDQADYSMWKLHFGVDTGSGAKAAFFSSADASVPEPSTYWLLGPATAWGASRWRFARRGGLHVSPHHRLCNLNSRTMVR